MNEEHPMKTKRSKNQQNEQESPHCRKCGGTDIDFEYKDPFSGQEVHEAGALRQALYYIATAAKEDVDQGGNANALKLMGGALAELAVMLEVREELDEDHEKATAEAQS